MARPLQVGDYIEVTPVGRQRYYDLGLLPRDKIQVESLVLCQDGGLCVNRSRCTGVNVKLRLPERHVCFGVTFCLFKGAVKFSAGPGDLEDIIVTQPPKEVILAGEAIPLEDLPVKATASTAGQELEELGDLLLD